MAWLKAPKTNHYFWLFHCSVWGVFILINFITRQINQVESLEQGLVSLVVLLLVNTCLCLILRELIHRYKLMLLGTPFVWLKLGVLVVVLGFLSAVLITVAMGFYYLLFGYTQAFVFFMLSVYQNWMVMVLVIGIWSVVYVVINHVSALNQLQSEQQQTKLQLKEAELNNLIGQLNPHFLFNGLNNIRGLMLEDVNRARHMLTELSDLLRYSLNQSKNSLTSLGQEIDVVRSYIELSQIQYEDRLEYQEDISSDLLPYQVPPMMIQLLVENAIKHGIDHHVGKGVLYLGVSVHAKILRIEVRNPGGLQKLNNKQTTQMGLGIANIKKRLQLLYADQASIKIYEIENQVVVEITLPATKQVNREVDE